LIRGPKVSTLSKRTRGGRSSALWSPTKIVGEQGSPPPPRSRQRARIVARPSKLDSKDGPAGSTLTHRESTLIGPTKAGPNVGIDVSKSKLDVSSDEETPFPVDRTAAGAAGLVDRLTPLGPSGVVMEATGAVKAMVTAAFSVAQLPVVVFNPKRARDLARAEGVLAKTDAIDAVLLARFGRKL
jgi:Transposase